MSRLMVTVLGLGVAAAPGDAQQSSPVAPQLERSIPAAMQALGAVGVSAAIVVDSQVVWSGAFGLADREHARPMERSTPVMLASASKVFTGAALLRLREDAGFSLDDDVSRYLPFQLRNPAYPDRPITFRMLLAHTSSIADSEEKLRGLYGNGDGQMSLAELINAYLSPSGRLYGQSFASYAPGQQYQYTNVTYALLGYLVERISGTSFDAYSRRALFEPLGMKSTSWFLRDLDSARVAHHYVTGAEPGSLRAVNHYGWPGYPDGQLRACADDVARFLAMLLNAGSYAGRQVLRPETVELMFEPQGMKGLGSPFLPTVDLALPWHINRLDDREIMLHTGRGSGISTATWVDRKQRVGGVLLITGPVTDRDGFIGLIRLLQEAGEWYARQS